MLILPGRALMLTVNPEPGSFSEIDGDISRIKGDIGGAQCGAWDWFTPVPPHIPDVTGVPGHNAADPLGHIRSGMALREETGGVGDGPIANTGFEFAPTWGYTTACRIRWPGFLEPHPCQRPGGDGGFASPKIFKQPSQGGNTVDPFGNISDGWTCDALCDDLNRRFLYDQYIEWSHFWDGALWIPVPIGPRRTVCYDTDTQPGPPPPTPNPPPPIPFFDPPPDPPIPSPPNNFVVFNQFMWCCTQSPVGSAFPNCKPCNGDACRQFLPSPYSPYQSYFRHFEGSCTRDPVTVVPDDDHERLGVPVACYGFYDEFDPKYRVTGVMDRHCVIANTYDGRDHDFVEMPQTQVTDMGQAEYGQTLAGTDWPDPPSGDYQIVRNPSFDVDIDLWYPNISGGFSLINGKVFDEVLNNDFTYALMAPDSTEFKSYPQLNEEQIYSSGAYMRGFDDSVSNDRIERRTITEWWQDIEFESHKLFSPPRVRLLLPPTWSVGLDPLDPFLSPELPTSGPTQDSDPRLEPLEVQLKVEDDLLGDVAAYMERSLLLRLQEEATPVLVPLGSPTEYRAKAHAWCTWYMSRSGSNNCFNLGGDIGDLIARLEEYAVQLDNFRTLRAELARYQASLLEDQNTIISTIGNWLNTNVTEYSGYQSSIIFLMSLKSLYMNAQSIYRNFHDKTNLPWCMNQRYTTPIYSMLDDWFPGRPDLDGCMDEAPSIWDPNCFPRFEIEMIPDAILDFSLVRTATGAMRIPILKPIQINLAQYELDPPDSSSPADIPKLPPLPPVPTIHAAVTAQLPDVVIEQNPPTISAFFPTSAPAVDPAVYGRAFDILMRMNLMYMKYWDSLRLDPASVVDGTEEDCLFPDQIPCVHVEMDLIERFVRMCSRPAVFLKEDFYQPGGAPDPLGRPIDQFIVDFDECPGNEDPRSPQQWNWACQPLNQEKYETQRGWGLRVPDEEAQEDFISGFREDMFKETLLREGVAEEFKLRFHVEPNEITPSFETLGTTELIPEAGSSSSSSSP